MHDASPPGKSSDLDKVIAPEIKNDAFYEIIRSLAATEPLRHVLEIGSSAGGGSTEAFVSGLAKNAGSPKLFCVEISKPRFAVLRETYKSYPFVHCYNRSTVTADQFPSPDVIADFYHSVPSGLTKFPLPTVLDWLQQDIRYIHDAQVEGGAIQQIKSDHGIDTFDMVLIDGSEFTGSVEYEQVKGAKLILLDDTNTFKCYAVRQALLADPMYDVITDDQSLRNGYSVFRRRSKPRIGTGMPIHFFTIVLNGEPFIRYHEKAFAQLDVSWHWHIVEGVAALKHDTAWSVAAGGRVADSIHARGRSNDGTSAYLDDLAQRFPDNVTLYRKPLDEFWDGKREMVNAPLPDITERCLLWQVDSDELWTAEQIKTVHRMFTDDPSRTAAYFWCWYFVGPDKIISTRYNYAQNPRQEWLRTWRYAPGATWAAHEPPVLVEGGNEAAPRNLAAINPFTQDEMERVGVAFQHFAYVTQSQAAFKEVYYGYKDAVAQWRALQGQTHSGELKDFFAWVTDNTMFDSVAYYPLTPLAKQDAATGNWNFPDDVDTAAPTRNAGVPRPRIVIDGVFWQYLSSGIGRVWENVLREWVKTGFIDNVILLDRAGTAPRIHGVHYWTIAKHDYAQTGRDSLYLEQVCRQLGADLFVSTYYSTPTTTPSFFSGYDMIPEVLGFPLAAEAWQEKRRAILHAAGHSMISRNSANDLERVYPELPRGRTHVVLVAADANFKPPGEGEIRAFKTKHGLADRRYVLMVGERFGHGGYKNGALAFRAAAMLRKDKSFTLVCIGGQAEIEQQLRSLAPSLDVRRLSLSDDELRAAYGGAHALLYPSKYEGFGMPPLESMACGTPAIVCNNSSLPEVVGDAAIFVSDGDPGEMRDALLRLVEPDVRNDLIQRGLQQAGRFTFGKMAIELSNALVSTHKRLAEGAALRPSAIWTEFRTLQQELQAGSDRSAAAPSILTADLENIRSLFDRATLKARRVAGKLLRKTGLRQ